MKLRINPSRKEWKDILARPVFEARLLREKVQSIIDDVIKNGDEALRKYSEDFDGVRIQNFQVSDLEIDGASKSVPEDLKNAISLAAKNIEKFHSAQMSSSEVFETSSGIECWQRSVGIEKVGLYVPGGSAPLFSTVLMLAIPARLAGCREIILCTPPTKNGSVNAAILFASKLTGVTKIFKIGGAHAIAAMANGTATVPQVYKIFGPGNQYVNCAKQLVQLEGVAIDMPAGPSEVCVMADKTATPAFVAADLLSQAEHGIDSQVLLIADSETTVNLVEENIQSQLSELPRKEIAAKVLEQSFAVVLDESEDRVDMANEYASEHLILCCENAKEISNRITNAGSIFIGNYSPEAAGDYASGPNHTLPTNGGSKAYSGLTVDSFCKKISYQQLSREGLISIGDAVIKMAEAEGLQAHANAIKLRK